MKKLTTLTAAITIAIIFSVNLNASPINFSEETYIDNIPVDTKCISAQCLYQKAISVEFNFEEE